MELRNRATRRRPRSSEKKRYRSQRFGRIVGSFVLWVRYTRCAMFVVAVLLIFLAPVGAPSVGQSPTNNSTLSPSEIAQLRSKAEAGDASAQVNLGKAYEDGNGVTQSDEQAVSYYQKAAKQGNAEAENDLGLMYRTGRGVEKSKEEAVKWYRLAARQGYPSAMFNLGTAYYNGDGVPVDDVISYAWFLLAQEKGNKAANDAVQRSSGELSSSQRSEALFKIGQMYQKGDDLPRDDGQCAKWYRMASDQGNAQAAVELAVMMIHGHGVPQDPVTAHHLCEGAAKQAYGPGAYCVGLIYREGVGVAKDPSTAAKWFTQAAEMHHRRAMFDLGEMYWKGIGVKPDKLAAYKWIFIAANSGFPDAKPDQEALEKELSAEQVNKARADAIKWVYAHKELVIRTPLK